MQTPVPPPPPARPYVLTRRRALWMGVLALLPALLFALIFVFFFGMMASEMVQQKPPHGAPAFFLLMFPVTCGLMVLSMAELVLYVVDVFRNPHVPENLRPMWTVLFFVMGMVAVPVYWFLYLWQPLRRLPAPGVSGPAA